MRILVQNRDYVGGHKGGDAIHCQAFVKALNLLGHDATFSADFTPDLTHYDFVILFHINFGWTWAQYQNILRYNKPYMMMAIFYPFTIETNIPQMKEMAENAKKVFFLSEQERDEFVSFVNPTIFKPSKLFICPNGYDPEFFFEDNTEKEYDVVIAGRFEPSKRIREVQKICNESGLTLAIAGLTWNKEYYDELKKFQKDTDFIAENLSHKELGKLYRKSEVYVCASLDERNSLGPIEAAACGCVVTSSTCNRGIWQFPKCKSFNPHDYDDMKQALVKVATSSSIQNKDIVIPTWTQVISQYIIN